MGSSDLALGGVSTGAPREARESSDGRLGRRAGEGILMLKILYFKSAFPVWRGSPLSLPSTSACNALSKGCYQYLGKLVTKRLKPSLGWEPRQSRGLEAGRFWRELALRHADKVTAARAPEGPSLKFGRPGCLGTGGSNGGIRATPRGQGKEGELGHSRGLPQAPPGREFRGPSPPPHRDGTATPASERTYCSQKVRRGQPLRPYRTSG